MRRQAVRVQKRLRRFHEEAVVQQPWADRRERRLAAGIERTVPAAFHLLVAAPGAGNIGDQAMIEALVEHADGDVVIVTRDHGDVDDTHLAARIVPLPALIFGDGEARRSDLAKYRGLLSAAASVSVIGADMMDGRYTLTGSMRRALLAELAASAGIPTRIIGFSWNADARAGAIRAARRAAVAGATLLLRDPESAARIRQDGVPGVVDTTDVVFTADRIDTTLADRVVVPGRPLAVVNASGLVARTVDQTIEYRTIVDHLVSAGMQVVLLPHVLRGTSDDLAACRAVRDAVGAEHVTLIETVATPSQVRGLARGAAVVVTGRMHLAVMALRSGVPAVTLATQGKVEGLMRRFGVPELCVTPGTGMGSHVVALCDDVLSSDRIRNTIAEHLPDIRALAQRNVEHLVTVAAQPLEATSPTMGGVR